MLESVVPPMDVRSVIGLILERCSAEQMLPPLKTRLVKLLYLAELEYYRRTKNRLMSLAWKFHHFGPYAMELAQFIGDPDVDAVVGLFGPTPSELVQNHDVKKVVADVVHEWGDADLNALLDYVYFETEPMQQANRGDVLDFSTIRPLGSEQRLKISLDPGKLAHLRRDLSARASDYRASRKLPVAAEDLFSNLKEWDSERNPRLAPGDCYIDHKLLD